MSIFLALSSLAHVPSYNCIENCCQLKHNYTVSQAFYLKGSGGLEVHLDTLNLNSTGYIDIDAVFRDEVDTTTYNLYIGCGGCMPEDPIIESPYSLSSYTPPEIEPFTQTVYRSIIPKNERKIYFTSLLNCSDPHFTIRLQAFENASTIFWSPVVGLGEQFTFLELLSFPLFIRRNHGNYWNEADYYYIWLLIVAPLLYYIIGICKLIYFTRLKNRINNYVKVFKVETFKRSKGGIYIETLFYDIAFIGFLASLIDKTFSIVYVQTKIEYTSSFWGSLLFIVVLPEFIVIILMSLFYKYKRFDFTGILTIFIGLLSFMFLGVGYFIGPSFLTLNGIYKLYFNVINNPL